MLKYTPNNKVYLKYCRSLLYIDNSIKPMNYVKHLCNSDGANDVQFIHVGETSIESPLVNFSDPYFDKFKKDGVPTNKYLEFIYANSDGGDHLDINSGIQANKHDKQIKKWIAHIQNRVSLGEINDKYRACVFLDWDRTLTMYEGIYRCSLAQLSNSVFINDMIVYLFGGNKRLKYIRGLIQLFIDNNIIPYVFTNNGLCKTEEFRLLYSYLHNGLQLLCSNEGLKHELVLKKEMFAQLCKPTDIRAIDTSIKHFNNIAVENNRGINGGINGGINEGINGENNTLASAGAGSRSNFVGGYRKKKSNKTCKIKRRKSNR